MRSLVCAQCHTEYYFKGDGEYLTFPHDKGFTVEDIEAYYDEMNYSDLYAQDLSRSHPQGSAPRLRAVAYGYPRSSAAYRAQTGHMPYVERRWCEVL